MDYIDQRHIAGLIQAGYMVIESDIKDNAPGYIVVADPVLCLSGSKKWAEVRRVRLRTPIEVFRFIIERE